MSIIKSLLITVAIGLLCWACNLSGQERKQAVFSGTVTDNSGAVVPGVEIILESLECVCSQCPHDCDCCPDQRTATSDDGSFSFSVGHGRYAVTFKKVGFHEVKVNVDLRKEDTKDVKISMPAGSVEH